ncbi:hypothetical protein Cpap_0434 [Ruminiclostridium papyrosolvens DSM 2782]|uniref:Uncharacterized protein n=1 Tax=Ruminiclostridium papyrosolvens DSM 2782 TaxID=588581 RepID=F1THD7_9FIRM|nr:hypothetical protein Cpap_0434 [Ruminiclostridium papyrosolvens DSM 2782]
MDGTLPYDYIIRSYTGLAGRMMRSYGHRAKTEKDSGTDYRQISAVISDEMQIEKMTDESSRRTVRRCCSRRSGQF